MKKMFVLSILFSLFVLSGLSTALPNPASTYCEEMGYKLQGEMCIFNDNTSCEQWAFYNGECGQNYTHEVGCAQAGENSGVAIQCCEGLTSISNSQFIDSGICAEIIGGYPICSDCGNQICEQWENECNCPEDCGIPYEECYDSDGGKNIYEKGTATKGSQSLTDHCNSDGSITEKYCENNEIKAATLNCPYGYICEDAACVKKEYSCYDSDGGKEPYKKGYVLLENEKWYDKCYVPESISNDGTLNRGSNVNYCNGNELCYVTEYFCSEGVGTDWIRCPYGCKDGACLRDIEQNLPPVIDGVSAPTKLKVGERGSWSIKAHDPENGVLSYSVDWDEYAKTDAASNIAATTQETSQTTTFTHSYSRAGTYTISITVTDDHSQTAKTSTSVNVVDEPGETCSSKQKIDITNVRNSEGKIAVDYLIGPDHNSVEVWFGHSDGSDLKKCGLGAVGACGISSSDPYAKCSVTTDCRYPTDSGTYMVTIHDRKCGLSDIYKFEAPVSPSEKWYRRARWVCYDGLIGPIVPQETVTTSSGSAGGGGTTAGSVSSTSVSGLTGAVVGVLEEEATAVIIKEVPGTVIEVPVLCKSLSRWKNEAEEFCKGHCSEETGKCGVNSFSVWDECSLPEETCSDSDSGKNYYEKGTTKSGSGKVKTDTCINCIGECQIDGPCSEPFCFEVEEYFCGKTGLESTTYACPNGCKDGACIKSGNAECYRDSDCGEGEKERYCSGDSACTKAKYPQCLNPGTPEAQCTYIGTGGCTPCPNGCSDGKCISGKCGDGICEENEACDSDCCEYYCQLYCPYGYVEGSCHCKCKEGKEIVCTDSDEGLNYYIPGIAVGPDGSFFADICYTDGKILQEGYCTKEGKVSSTKYECPKGCEKGTCIEEGKEETCSGCSYESACLPIGFRRGSQYCDIDHKLKEQKTGTDACDNHHECTSNVCVNGKCVSPSFIDAIISWFSSLFGG